MYIVQDGLPFKDKLERDAPNLIEGYLLDVAFTNMFNLKQKEKKLVHRYKCYVKHITNISLNKQALNKIKEFKRVNRVHFARG
jgi:hypothetical protein